VSYLQEHWTEKEVAKFIRRTQEMSTTLKRYPEMYHPSTKRKKVRIAMLDKNTQLIYHYTPKRSRLKFCSFGA
jgi:hypothetical protein